MKKLSLSFLFFAVSFLSGISAAWANTSFKSAEQYYQDGQYTQAFDAYKKFAILGDAFSQYTIGYMYLQGQGVNTDYNKAIAWMRVAERNAPGNGFGTQADQMLKRLAEQGIKLDIEPIESQLMQQYSNQAVINKFTPVALTKEQCAKQKVKWLSRTPPKYPLSKAKFGQSGSVYMSYHISAEGYVRDVQVEAESSSSFTKKSLSALQRWRADASNRKLISENNKLRMDFTLNNTKLREERLAREFEESLAAAKNGGIRAQYKLARMIQFWGGGFGKHQFDISKYGSANEWLTKAATQGHPIARYDLGMRMIQGRECEPDLESGIALISASAIAGYAPAQGQLALELFNQPDADIQEVIALLTTASESGHYLSAVSLAWLLSTHPNKKIRSGKEALKQLEKETGHYFDEVRVLETKAAAYAATGDFDEAEDYQEDAIDLAEDYGWEIPVMKDRLQAYKDEKIWQGEYYL